MQTLFRFRRLVLAVPFLMGFALVVTTAGCGGGGTKIESTSGPTPEEQKAKASYEEIMKKQKKGSTIVK